MSSYSIYTVAIPPHVLYKSFKTPKLLHITKFYQCHGSCQGPLQLFTTLSSYRITLNTPHKDAPTNLHPGVPSQLSHYSLPAACSGIPALALCGIALPPSVLPPLPASDAGPSLEAEERPGKVGEIVVDKMWCRGRSFPGQLGARF